MCGFFIALVAVLGGVGLVVVPSRRFDEARFVLMVVEALRLAKQRHSYRELSRATGIPAPHLSRYVTGRGLPSPEKAKVILDAIWRLENPRRVLAERLAETGGVLDTSVILTDPLYLLLVSLHYADKIRGKNITRILVPEASGIPFATAMSMVIERPFTVARRGPITDSDVCSSTIPSFCIPRNTLSRTDNVLIVDDIVETGKTLKALRDLVERSGARIAHIAAIVVVGEEWVEISGFREVDALVILTKPGARRVPSL
ncbi:phosphoribosyltransferase family protein [Pyrofollis japonicus]|uniref:phosphoribosyltransferase family protein n=1 Tax=Pyrofollis japonicus TaxID=3060460 RepID=UPI00295BA6A4|nr:phosphoribosyltransferase family protein [Pyrofollis japonicus]BEP17964.1 phosphoribosyltransferase family protein [Pyrofollis japonicus]